MNVSFYMDDTARYGNFTSEIAHASSHHYAWCWRAAANSEDPVSVWLPGIAASCKRAVQAGRKIHLNLDMTWPTPVDTVLNYLYPYRASIDLIEVADEPPWNAAGTKNNLQLVRAALNRCGYGARRLGIVYSTKQFPGRPGKIPAYDFADWIGIEAYLEPPGDKDSAYNVEMLTTYVSKALAVATKAHKEVVMIPMAYSRNGAWRGLGSPDPKRNWQGPYLEPGGKAWKNAVRLLKELQQPIYDLCRSNKAVIAYNMFSWGRWYGAREYPALAAECLRIGAAACR
jgi:hypothetical protein